MSFSRETWSPCADAIACPCPNHLSDAVCLPAIFSDVISENSPLHTILHSNNELSPDEEDLLNSSIADLQSKITAADNSSRSLCLSRQFSSWDTKKIDWELQRLQRHGDALAAAVERRKNVAASWIKRLPSEVLAHILFLAIGVPFQVGKPPAVWNEISLGNQLTKFELVSKRWRACILGHPKLWSRILVVADWPHPSQYWQRVARQIRYSGQARLEVCITVRHPDSPVCVYDLPETVRNLLAPIARRIQSLHLFITEPLIRGLRPLRGSFQALKELFISLCNTALSHASGELLNLFLEAPNLALYETSNVTDPSLFGIPWPQITRYRSSTNLQSHFSALPARPFRNALSILSAAAGSIQEASFRDMVAIQSPPPQIVSELKCAYLVSLELTLAPYTESWRIRQVFELCAFPVLARLDVMLAPDVGPDEYNGLDAFTALVRCIQRSHSPLRRFKLDQAHVASADVTEFFRTVPTLEEVCLVGICSGIDSDVIRGLCVQENGAVPLPSLQSLHLDGNLTFNLGLFVEMVKGRWDAAAPLFSITIGWSGLVDTALNRHQRRTLQRMRKQKESEVAVLVAELKKYESQGMVLQAGLNDWNYNY